MERKEKHFIILNGSPKIGNTYRILSWIAEGIEKEGGTFEMIHITKLDIEYCRGCHTCLRTGKCVIHDDLQPLIEKVEKSSGVVVGSPVYAGYPTSQFKTIIDRTALLKLYTGILEDKYTIGVATSGVAPTRKTAKTAAITFGRVLDWMGVKSATIKGGYQDISKEEYPKDYKNAKNLGKKLVRKSQESGTKRSLKYAWINFLRKHILKKLVIKNREQFKGVYKIFQEKGWIND